MAPVLKEAGIPVALDAGSATFRNAGRKEGYLEEDIPLIKTMLDAGIKVAGSSDCIVEPPHPLWGIAAAMDRHGINPSQALSGRQALGLFTEGAAGSIRERPPLAVGSPADLVVVDTDITAASPEEVRTAQVIETFVDGDAVAVDRELPVWMD